MIFLHNPTSNAIMKVRDLCYEGTLRGTPMTLSREYSPTTCALPSVSDTYQARGNMKISEVKQDHLKQVYTNFVLRERWHELLSKS